MSASPDFQTRVRRAVIEYAFMRWESAVVLVLTGGLTLFTLSLAQRHLLPGWVWPICLGLGVLAEAVLIYTSLTDTDTNQQLVAKLLRDSDYPQRLHDPGLQAQVDKAFDYHTRIQTVIGKWRNSGVKAHLNDTTDQISAWLQNIYILARQLDRWLQERDSLDEDSNRAKQRVAQLKKQGKGLEEGKVQQQLTLTLTGLERQIQAIETLENTMTQAQLQLEHTLSALSTLYSQTMLIEARELDGARLNRVRDEINNEISSLGDILSAMENVYSGELRPGQTH